MARMLRLAVAAMSAAAALGAAACATPFDATKDYYPIKYDVKYATNYRVTYGKAFKFLNVTTGSRNYYTVLTPCGAPKPTNAELGVSSGATVTHVVTPVTSVSVLSSVMLSWVELLGGRSAITSVDSTDYVDSPCLRKQVEGGATKSLMNPDTFQLDTAALAATAPQAVICSADYGCPGTPQDVPVADFEDAKRGSLPRADWIGFVGMFFDAEAKALAMRDEIGDRLSCNKAIVSKAIEVLGYSRTPKVLWAYRYCDNWTGACTWSLGKAGTYYAEAIAAAGGELVTSSVAGLGAYGTYTDEQFASLPGITSADIWIVPQDPPTVAAMRRYFPGAADPATDAPVVTALMARMSAIATAQVYDVTRSHINAWFQYQYSYPELLLQDLVTVIRPYAYAVTGSTVAGSSTGAPFSHTRVFLRNIFSELSGALPATSTCTDSAAPAWLQSSACPATTVPTGPYSAPVSTGDSEVERARLGGGLAAAFGGLAVLGAAAYLIQKRRAAAAAGVPRLLSSQPPESETA